MTATAKERVKMMGTFIDIQITAPDAEALVAQVIEWLKQYETRFSANDPASELSAINSAAGKHAVTVHPELFELIQLGKTHSLASPSYLNIAIGPLIQTWRIGFSDAQVPSDATVQSKLTLIDSGQIDLDAATHSVLLKQAGMQIDLGALAKGYIADRIMARLKEKQVTNALLNLGGNLVTLGYPLHREDKKWRIGIQDPTQARGYNELVLAMTPGSVVTSGIYERFLTINGKTYHHIFDSQTGYPIQTNVASLTILSEQSVMGEIWTTRLFGLPISQIIDTVNHEPGIEAIVIDQAGKIYSSQEVIGLIA